MNEMKIANGYFVRNKIGSFMGLNCPVSKTVTDKRVFLFGMCRL